MNLKHKQKILLLILFMFGIAAVSVLILYALRQNINLFYAPQELLTANISDCVKVRVGGMVLKDSLQTDPQMHTQFVITDFKSEVIVQYTGVLPDLFREGQGVVAQGYLDSRKVFQAEQILAKHDENYMPPQITEKLDQVNNVT